MQKLFYVLILVAFVLLVAGCSSTGNIDWDVKAEKQPISYDLYEVVE